MDQSSKKQRQKSGLEQGSHISDPLPRASKQPCNGPSLEFGHGERRSRKPTEKESLKNNSLSPSVSTYSSTSKSHSYTSSGSNSPSVTVTSESSSYSSPSSKSTHSTHAEMQKNGSHEKYPSDTFRTEPMKRSSANQGKVPSSPRISQSARRSLAQGSNQGRRKLGESDHGYQYIERRREPLRLQSNDERRREPLRLQPNDERRREPLSLQPNDERRREPLRLQPNDERRREPLRLQPNEERRREPLRLQSNDERRREPLRLQPNDERRREPLRLQPNDERSREPLRLQPNDERRREPLRLQSNDERRREQHSRLQTSDERRRGSRRLQSSIERRREEPSRLRETSSRLQSDATPQYSGIRRLRRSPAKTGIEIVYKKVSRPREESSDYRGDSHQSFGHTRINRSPLHLSSRGRHVGSLSSQVYSSTDRKQDSHNDLVLPSGPRASYRKQDEREIVPRDLQNRKRRASPDLQLIDFAQKRMHVEERGETDQNTYSQNEPKERRRSNCNDTRRHHETEHSIAENSPEEERQESSHRKKSQDHARFLRPMFPQPQYYC